MKDADLVATENETKMLRGLSSRSRSVFIGSMTVIINPYEDMS